MPHAPWPTTLFGRWMHATGWAGPLVMLGFAGSWALPLITSVVAGDIFASEDRLGTWRHLLVSVRSPRRIFVGKTLAGLTVLLFLLIGLVVSAAVGGVLAVGNQPLIGLDGHLLPAGDAGGRVLAVSTTSTVTARRSGSSALTPSGAWWTIPTTRRSR